MKINKKAFYDALITQERQIIAKYNGDIHAANYELNMSFNFGRANYYQIDKCKINGVMFYCAAPCKTANTDASIIKRVCARF